MTDLLASFAAAGGAPPASHELVRVFRDGTVRALAATPWPGLGPVKEAGAYAFELDPAALAGRAAGRGRRAGAPRWSAGAGFGALCAAAGGGEPLRWGPLTTPPAPVAALAHRLRELLVEARAHPLAAVRIDLDVAGGELTYRATALGDEPLLVTSAHRGRASSRRRNRPPSRRRSPGP